MTDIIVTQPIKVRELIQRLEEEFGFDDYVTTGLWIKKLNIKTKKKHVR